MTKRNSSNQYSPEQISDALQILNVCAVLTKKERRAVLDKLDGIVIGVQMSERLTERLQEG